MKEIKVITLEEAHKRYITRHTHGFYSISAQDEMTFGKYVDRLKEIEKLSIL